MRLFVLTLLAGCQQGVNSTGNKNSADVGKVIPSENGSYKNITVAELQEMMKAKDFLLVNVHTPFEGNLPKTDLSIPYDTIDQNLGKLPSDKNAKIVLYCRSDRMSTIASKEMVKLGYTNIWNMVGGMVAWEQAGQPIEK